MRFNKGGSGGGGGSFERPPVGYAVGVLAAIYDLGVRETPGSSFGPRHQICLWWELNHRDSKGQQHTLRDVVTMSTMEGSHLATRIEALLGRDMTESERGDFDPVTVLGKRCKLLLAVSPKRPDGSPFVKMAMPVEKSDPPIVVEGDYSQLPRFVEKLASDPARLEQMRRELAAGGGDYVSLAPKGPLPGSVKAPAGAAKTAGQPVPPPPPPTPPASDLPAGWRVVQGPDGNAYYAHQDGRTQWERPEAAPPPPPPARRGKAAAQPPAPPVAPVPKPEGDDDIPF